MTKPTYIRLGEKILDLRQGLVMGILNATPDSFYEGSRVANVHDLIDQVEKMVDDGMDILDIGSVSSRPGANLPDIELEWQRLAPVLQQIRSKFADLPVSVDTFRSDIARRSVNEYGVNMINDISGGLMDKLMPGTIAELQVPIALMHMKGKPQTMQKDPVYNDVVMEIIYYFSRQTKIFRELGVHDIIIDPGFGFGKTADHNFEILNKLDLLSIFEMPVLVGVSRKSMINKTLNITSEQSLNGTTVINTIARMNGADILRVHDVREARECLRLVNRLK
ncbi:MAG: dihydropteroate synthase [Bacteroidales bacterium]|nr:dihydropteroate synthase [Bacteroidales bacterium]